MMKTILKSFFVLLGMMLGGASSAWAQNVDGLTADQTFDFANLAQQSTTISWGNDYTGSGLYNSPKYMDLNGINNRIASASKSDKGWFLRNDAGKTIGLWNRGSNHSPQLAICNLWNGDRVRITLSGSSIKFVESNSAKVNNLFVTAGQEASNTVVFSAVKTGDVIIEGKDNYTVIQKIEIFNAYNGSNNNFSVSFNNPPTQMNVGESYDGYNANISPSYVTPTFTSSNEAVASVNEYGVVTALKRGTTTITAKLDVGPEGAPSSQHKSAQFTIKVNNPNPQPKYAYDPAIEVYDLTGKSWSISQGESAGYKFYTGGYDAYYISNPDDYELNNRLAIQNGLANSWSNDNGLKSSTDYRLIGINNLRDGDRVKITFSGNVLFSSRHEYNKVTEQFSAANKVFYDIDNDGEQDCEDDKTISDAGTAVVSNAWYTMLEAGHLDLAVGKNAVITKIEIYSDRKAAYIDTDNGDGSHTLTFDGTGQLLEKTAYIPGLKIEFGDADAESEHFFVTQSDKGPVSWGEDPEGFKMALNGQGTSLSAVPTTGTYYKFIPEVSGKLKIDFKAMSVSYGESIYNHKSSNETVTSVPCPYVVLDVNGNTISTIANQQKGNGAAVTDYYNGFNLVKGHTYYFFGWWANENIAGSCGVAKLLSATYQPAFQMPVLAAVGTNGMTSFDGSTCTPKVTISGNPTNLKFEVKRTSANISVNASDILLEDGYLKISSITYNDPNKDKAGVILVKATAAEGEHVFALTIPYSAAYNTDANGNSEGHTWNFTDQPLEIGNYYSDFYAISGISDKQKPTDEDLANASKNTRSTLYQEINKADGTTDWTYTYRQVGTNGTFKDPMFQNVYNMEGDNADMIWETEGLWFDTPSNKSAIMNETTGAANHSSATDPDRYVAILPDASGKSSFTIPGLKKDDRVRIYMGSGDGSSTDACFFNITNARDAVYREISESDVYKAGGTYWDLSGTSYNYYASYHFFAKADGPMTFKMVGGSMTKIYKIEIYRGARRFTNGVLGERQYFHSQGDGTSNAMYMHLHHRGKGESLANGQHVSNEMVATSGNISASNITLTPNGNDLKWTVNEGAFGVAKMRLKCMEYNQKYVTDYADFNVTVGYKEKVNYPKTWDFTDMTTYSGEDISTENTKYPVADIPSWDDAASYDLSMWDADGKMIVRNPTATDNSQEIFTQNKNGNGNQLYANNKIIPETKGLWFYFDNNDPAYNGSMQITTEGLRLANTPKKKEDGVTDLRMGWWNYKMVIPNVPSKAAVYLRVKRVAEVDETYESTDSRGNKSKFFNKKYRFDHMPTYNYTEDGKTKTQYVKYEIGATTTEYLGNTSGYTYNDTYTQYSKYYQANDGSGDYIIAVYNWGEQSNLTFTLNGFVLKKLAVSDYKKTLNDKGWATECRNDVIDPALTGYMTGKDMRTYIATTVDFPNKKVTLLRIDKDSQKPEFKGYLMDKATAGGDDNACIIRNVAVGDENPKLQILDGGFHLFVPDMHDYIEGNTTDSKKMKWNDGTNLNNELVSVLNKGTIASKTGEMTNYAFTCKYVDIDPETGIALNNNVKTGDQAFYRIAQSGATSSTGNQAYLPILVPKPATSRALEASAASAESTATPLNFSITLANRSDVMTNLGDVNNDGMFNQTDVESMTNHVTGRPTTTFFKGLADINGDGVVDIIDVTRLIRKLGNE